MAVDPRHEITITRRVPIRKPALDRIDSAVRHTLKHHDIRRAQISIVIVDDGAMADLNQRYLDHKGPTDVLTFDLADHPRDKVEGEIVISADTAAREAKLRNNPMATELALYAVHGTLHLLGYDDRNQQSFSKMHRVENEIFTAMGLGTVFSVCKQPLNPRPKQQRTHRKNSSITSRPTGARAT